MGLDFSEFKRVKLADIVGIVYGHKKLISTGLYEGLEEDLTPTLRKYGLHCRPLGVEHDYRQRRGTLLIAADKSTLDSAERAYAARDYTVIGRLLGYPDCCVKRYCAILQSSSDDFVRKCALNSEKFFWPLNNLLDFDGRLKAGKSPKLPHGEMSFISHNPCAYDCQKSLRLAELNCRLILKHMNRPWQEHRFSLLSDPVLYLDDFNFASLRGASEGPRAEFSGTGFVMGLGGLKGKLANADALSVEGGGLRLFKRGRSLHHAAFGSPPLLLPFDRSAR